MPLPYTAASFDEVRYGVVQIQSASPPSLTLPAPQQVPEVAEDQIPTDHDARRSAGADGYAILVRHVDEDDPLPDAGIDWLTVDEMRQHIADNADVWDSGASL